MEINGTIQPKNNINGGINVGGIIQGSGEDFDEKIIPYDARITQNTNNITNLSQSVTTLTGIVNTHGDAIESINERVGTVEDNVQYLDENKADKSEVPNVPTWAMQDNKPTYTSTEIPNTSNVEGAKVTNALNNLNTHINVISDEVDENIQSISNLGTSVNNISQSVGALTTTVNELSITVGVHATNINQLNQSLSKCEVGNRIDILSYTSSFYTCPDDGYIFIYNSNTNGYVFLGTSKNVSIGGTDGRFTTFVRKGTKVQVSGSLTIACFTPLI